MNIECMYKHTYLNTLVLFHDCLPMEMKAILMCEDARIK